MEYGYQEPETMFAVAAICTAYLQHVYNDDTLSVPQLGVSNTQVSSNGYYLVLTEGALKIGY